jgi:uncharacterized coiled-coil protein SlyX
MFKFRINIIVLVVGFFLSFSAFSQSIEGLQGIVSSQQEKITTIENTLKTLIGSIEQFEKDENLNKNEINSKPN